MDAIYAYYRQLGNVDTVAHSCYPEFAEIGTTYQEWGQRNISAMDVALNVMFNFGSISNSLV